MSSSREVVSRVVVAGGGVSVGGGLVVVVSQVQKEQKVPADVGPGWPPCQL